MYRFLLCRFVIAVDNPSIIDSSFEVAELKAVGHSTLEESGDFGYWLWRSPEEPLLDGVSLQVVLVEALELMESDGDLTCSVDVFTFEGAYLAAISVSNGPIGIFVFMSVSGMFGSPFFPF